jgi:DNA-binding MarR family transcriptional regulator
VSRANLTRIANAAADPSLDADPQLAAETGAHSIDAVRQGPAVDLAVYEGLAGFRSALRRFLSFSEARSVAAGVTPQQYQAMLVIRTHPDQEIMIRALAEQMLLLPNSAVQLVDRLSASELVERRQSPTDRRSVLVSLTAKGSQLLERLAAEHRDELLRHEPLLADSLARLRRMGAPK